MTMYDFIDQKKVVMVTFAVILAISALIAPAALFYPIKAMFITPLATHIGTNFISLITGSVGLLLIAAALIVLVVIDSKAKRYSLAAVLVVVGVLGTALSLSDYYYMTSEKFVYNGPWEFTEHTYTWDDFDRIEEHVAIEGGTRKTQAIALFTKDGNEIKMSTGTIFLMAGSLTGYIEQAGGTSERVVVDDEASE